MPGVLAKLVALGWVAIAGCSLSPAPQTPTITLTLSSWQSNPEEKRLLGILLRRFEATYPGIQVRHEVINDQYMDVIKTRLIGDAAPDVFYLDAFEAPALMQAGVLEPLDSYLTPGFELKDFEPALLAAFQVQGQTYGIPKDFSTLALFYNPQAFQAAGIAAPPRTWTELRAAARRLTVDRNGDGKLDQYGLGLSPELARQAFMLRAYGGTLTDSQGRASFAQPAGLKGLQQVIDQYRSDRTSIQPSDAGASSGSDLFGQGKVAMVIEGPWAIPYLQETFPALKFATAEVPRVEGRPGTMAFTVAYVMNRQGQHKQAAWQLIAYLTDRQGMQTWAEQGLAIPTRRSVLATSPYRRQPLYQPFIAGASYAMIWQAGETLPILLSNFNNQFISALLGQQSLEAAMQKAENTANREIEFSR